MQAHDHETAAASLMDPAQPEQAIAGGGGGLLQLGSLGFR